MCGLWLWPWPWARVDGHAQMRLRRLGGLLAAVLLHAALPRRVARAEFVLLDPLNYRAHFVEGAPCPQPPCNRVNDSTYVWATENIPFFDCDDPDLVAAYYFRVKTYKSHIIHTDLVDAPYVVSEFGPAVHWGGTAGAINAAAGHHIHDGRWIRDSSIMDSEIGFWFGRHHTADGKRAQGGNDAYSSWIISSAVARAEVLGNMDLLVGLLPELTQWWEGKANGGYGPMWRMDCYEAGPNSKSSWPECLSVPPSQSKSHWPQCYGTLDGWDAMEGSISGAGCRPSNNAMMYGEALAIAKIAQCAGNYSLSDMYAQRAAWLQETYLKLLWDDDVQFFSVYKLNPQDNPNWVCNCTGNPSCPHSGAAVSSGDGGKGIGTSSSATSSSASCPHPYPEHTQWPCNHTVAVRELLGLGPAYYFKVPPIDASVTAPTKYDRMWLQLDDSEGFLAEWGPTTVERRHPCFNYTQDSSECNWAGPSWPFETSRVLTGMANYLVEYPSVQHTINHTAYMRLLRTYARSHTRSYAVNGSRPWIGENIEPDRGYWIAREVMYSGGGTPPIKCDACRADPRVGNCAGRTYVPACCNVTPPMLSCDGKELPTDDRERGKDYLHSSYLDLIISGMVGLRPSIQGQFTVFPLFVPRQSASSSFFALDNVAYHGHNISIAYDGSTGSRSRNFPDQCRGNMLCVWVDGQIRARSPGLDPVNVSLNSELP